MVISAIGQAPDVSFAARPTHPERAEDHALEHDRRRPRDPADQHPLPVCRRGCRHRSRRSWWTPSAGAGARRAPFTSSSWANR
ncbi:MAG: hypothetical protein MZV70_20295 [Desulfobacterales bacterium]|nr:hypothetical protein [Desulfobacterales bacterium]